MSEHIRPQPAQDEGESKSPPRDIHRWTSEQLLGSASEAFIVHGNEVYRLLRTRNDKLILVK